MKPYAKYVFINMANRFKPYQHTGTDIAGSPPEWISVYKKHSKSKEKNSLFFEYEDDIHFSNILLLGDSSYMGLQYSPEIPYFHYGVLKNDAVLIKFKKGLWENITTITFWFFEGMKSNAIVLHHQWISCDFELD